MLISNLEMTQAIVEIFSAFACLMFIVIIVMNRTKQKSMQLICWMFGVVAVLFTAEAGAYIFRGNTDSVSLAMTRITNFLVFLANIVLAEMFVAYISLLLLENGTTLSKAYRPIAVNAGPLGPGLCVLCYYIGLAISVVLGFVFT